MNLQITIDTADPHRLAAFYQGAGIGYSAEDHTAAVEQLAAQGLIGPDEIVRLGERQGFTATAACSDPTGRLPRLHFQRVDEPKTGKNRLHLDLQFPGDADARDDLVDRLLELGAREIGQGSQGPAHHWVIVADPEGNELCVSN
ncbi:MAG: VOC family protein [Ilumatobacter sp.]|uniref:VOC family protein n=1 Tax=Ilumatobacter sp. TaxID=1967498 RepID=UPI0026306DB2|nr:VOC family protein [Ilumatobacter sp.]MDJ0770824.1 VOC family protein [Ilumatobacter sp.]